MKVRIVLHGQQWSDRHLSLPIFVSTHNQLIQVLGIIAVTVRYKEPTKHLTLLVVPTDGPALFGQDWLNAIIPDWKELNHVHSICHSALQDVLNQYAGLFKEGMGTLQGTMDKIHIQQDTRPCSFHARPVPYAPQDKGKANLELLCKADIIKPVQFSDWAAPIVLVLKSYGSLWICCDYKETVNQVAVPGKYPPIYWHL